MFPVSSVSKYQFRHETGHYSQMVWATTSRLGCGMTEYKLGSWVAKYEHLMFKKKTLATAGLILLQPGYERGAELCLIFLVT